MWKSDDDNDDTQSSFLLPTNFGKTHNKYNFPEFTSSRISLLFPPTKYARTVHFHFVMPSYLHIIRFDKFDSPEDVNHGDLDLHESQAHANTNTRPEPKRQKGDRAPAPFSFVRKSAQRYKRSMYRAVKLTIKMCRQLTFSHIKCLCFFRYITAFIKSLCSTS